MTAPFEFYRTDGTRIGAARSVEVAEGCLFVAELDAAEGEAFARWTPDDLVVRDNVEGRCLPARDARVTFAIPAAVASPRFQFACQVEALERVPWTVEAPRSRPFASNEAGEAAR